MMLGPNNDDSLRGIRENTFKSDSIIIIIKMSHFLFDIIIMVKDLGQSGLDRCNS